MNKPMDRLPRRAEDIPQSEIDVFQNKDRHTWVNIAKLFQVSQQTVHKNWKVYAGFPEDPNPQAVIDFMKVRQSGGSEPLSESMEEIREKREVKELEKVSIHVVKATLEVERLKGHLCEMGQLERTIGALLDIVMNTTNRLDGVFNSKLETHWLKKHKEKPPRKLVNAIREVSKDVAQELLESLSDEGTALFEAIEKEATGD
jgi:hypothetical protein